MGADQGWPRLQLVDVFQPLDLIKFLIWRDLKVRYRQTAIGGAWAVFQPLMMVAIFTFVFGRLSGLPSDGLPYALFSFAGLVPWTYFSQSVSNAANSVVSSSQLIEKIYFHRLTIPIATVLSSLMDLAICFVFLVAAMLVYGYLPTWRILFCIPMVALATITAIGVGSMLAALNVRFRDVRHTMPFLMQFWLYATPVAYPSSLAPESWRLLLGLNPMAGVVEGFRWALFGSGSLPEPIVAVSALTGCIAGYGGMMIFRRMERGFADVI